MNMNVRPDPRMNSFGTGSPGGGGGWRGFASLIAFGYRWRYYGLIGLAVLGAAETLPDGYRPTDLFGRSIASIETSDIKAKQDTVTAYQKGLADAQAQAQAQGAQQVELFRQQQSQLAAAQQGQVAGAVVADLGCLLGGLMGSASDPGVSQTGQTVAKKTCGIGDALRNKMAGDQAHIIDQTGVTRAWTGPGATTSSGTVAVVAPPDAPPLSDSEKDHLWTLATHATRPVLNVCIRVHGRPESNTEKRERLHCLALAAGEAQAQPSGVANNGTAIAATAEAAPLNQGEFMRMARLEQMLVPDAVQKLKAGSDLGTNQGMRMYLARLGVAAGEGGDDDGPTLRQPVIVQDAPQPDHWQLPDAVRSKQNRH